MIGTAVYFLVIIVLGYAVLCAILHRARLPLFEFIPLVVGLGLGFAGTFQFWLSLLGLKPSQSGLMVLGVTAGILIRRSIASGKIVRIQSPADKISPGDKTITVLAGIPLFFALLIVLVHALGHGMYEWDAYMLWGFKAKVLSTNAIRDAGYFSDLNFAMLHLNYPLMIPFLMAGINGAAGEMLEILPKLIFPIFYLTMGMFLYSGLRSSLPVWQATALTTLFLTGPHILRWSGSGLADVPLAAFYSGAILQLIKWVETENSPDLLLSGIFAGFCGFTKNEGLLMVLLITAAVCGVLIYKKCASLFPQLLHYGFGVAVITGPWLIYRRQLPKVDENYLAHFSVATISENLGRLDFIAVSIIESISNWQNWNALWIILGVLAAIRIRQTCQLTNLMLWGLLATHIFAYALIYLIGPLNPDGLMQATLDRLLIHVSPVALLIVGRYCSGICGADAWSKTPRRSV